MRSINMQVLVLSKELAIDKAHAVGLLALLREWEDENPGWDWAQVDSEQVAYILQVEIEPDCLVSALKKLGLLKDKIALKRERDADRKRTKRGQKADDENTSSLSPTTPISPCISLKENNNIQSIPEKTKKTGNTAEYIRSFERFWEVYPKKVARQDALKAWCAMKPNDMLVADIIRAVERTKSGHEWTAENGRFIPYPGTYLRGQRWMDKSEVDINGGHAIREQPDWNPDEADAEQVELLRKIAGSSKHRG